MNITLFNVVVTLPPHLVQVAAAAALGLALGCERALHKKTASFTTFSLISLGSCLLTTLALAEAAKINGALPQPIADPLRIPSYIINSIGFACAGVIIFDKKSLNIEGITTAVMLWLSACIGICCGFNRLDLAFWGVVLYFVMLKVARLSHVIVEKLGLVKEQESDG